MSFKDKIPKARLLGFPKGDAETVAKIAIEETAEAIEFIDLIIESSGSGVSETQRKVFKRYKRTTQEFHREMLLSAHDQGEIDRILKVEK